MFALTVGVAYANEDVMDKSGGKELYNGIADFTGKTADAESDIVAASITMGGSWVEGSGAGSLSASDPGVVLNNGITDFTGRTPDAESDNGAAGITMDGSSVEGAGG